MQQICQNKRKTRNNGPNYIESDIETDFKPMAIPQSPPRPKKPPDPDQIPLADTIDYSEKDFDNESLDQDDISHEQIDTNTFVTIPELIQCRPGNVMYFVDSSGTPCDEGARALEESNRLSAIESLELAENKNKKPRSQMDHENK
ncbi:hypothetical protein QAD02_007681 [Eretmocerus hayati]|uniref:Uncharacterized protein n=1 Tax=Eretmocerus hayati TaxID=131215 RepID=A0ACC2N6S1_9HYME|nr:hypothetical protein QAD02_007681 [Eretmocerus hayati]